jgi:hypothetical protein
LDSLCNSPATGYTIYEDSQAAVVKNEEPSSALHPDSGASPKPVSNKMNQILWSEFQRIKASIASGLPCFNHLPDRTMANASTSSLLVANPMRTEVPVLPADFIQMPAPHMEPGCGIAPRSPNPS